ncbi:N-acetylmuramoyl-L-alanine amidase [Saccharopolyspora erythraea]|uniref:peptidoglycan recognition protein family protein n=1 Tax=Saccharopolyspora erythraea TaxID=1836 RepID=UPI001BA96DE4|nr:N-acetylmuramoyl-L-alanine amidase [Saccharopolyspora erythraea]QUG99536.1 N-acetylmuramoyl-L-alanine amidase [Saccharopolyspora erythraea]
MRLGLTFPCVLLLTAALATTVRAEPPEAPTGTVVVPLGDSPSRGGEREVRLDQPFSMVGLTWSGEAPDRVELRPLTEGGWGTWTDAELTSARGSEPVWTGRTTGVQVRATRGGDDVTGELRLVALRPSAGSAPVAAPPPGAPAPDPTPEPTAAPSSLPEAPSSAAGPSSAVATPRHASAPPPLVRRADWGADERSMTWTPQPTETRAAVVHHTAGTNDYGCADSAAIVRGIFEYHAVHLGWGDIGYHALVDKCGTIFEGRAQGLERDVIGGHAMGFNPNTFGVAMLGSFQDVVPTSEALTATGAIIGWKLRESGVAPDSAVELVSTGGKGSLHPPGAGVRLPAIFAHRDVGQTLCPGQLAYDRLDEIRSAALG